MSTPYVGEIRMFGGSFAPAGWAFCSGQIMPISENDVLFTLIGTTYGGDGQETFALPNLMGRVPIHMGQGRGLSNYIIGEMAGTETVTLTPQQIPAHNHTAQAQSGSGNQSSPQGGVWAAASTSIYTTTAPTPPSNNFNTSLINLAGGSQPHENMMPYLTISFIISLFGIFPSQS
jgi:microcystin-dependent protein